jgi:hypothetical protein
MGLLIKWVMLCVWMHWLMAMLSASVPPEVKKISAGVTLSSFATVFLAVSMAARVFLPNEWMEEGLPKSSSQYGIMAFNTSSSSLVVAALSK